MSISVTESTFEEELKNTDKVVLVDFGAAWCGPCRAFEKTLATFEETHKDVKVLKVDVDQAQSLAQKFNIRSIPTVLSFKDGQQVERKVGNIGAKELDAVYQRALKA